MTEALLHEDGSVDVDAANRLAEKNGLRKPDITLREATEDWAREWRDFTKAAGLTGQPRRRRTLRDRFADWIESAIEWLVERGWKLADAVRGRP